MVTQGIFDHLDVFGEQPALIDEQGQALSYKALIELGDSLASRVRGRCLVMILCQNSTACISGYVGLQRAGAVTLLVNHKTDHAALAALVDAFRPAYVFLPDERAESLSLQSPVAELGSYCLAPTGQATDYEIYEHLALLLGTSGSTGSPDYVRISKDNLRANAASIIQSLDIRPADRAITTMPMSYSYGLSIINTHLMRGASVVVTEATLMEKVFWNLIKDAGVTTFGGVPFIYQMLDRLRFGTAPLPSLRYVTQAGGKLEPRLGLEIAQRLAKQGVGFVTMYGQTEATARMTYLPSENMTEKPGSIGVPIPGGRIWLADEQGQPVAAGQRGEIVYEGENVSLGTARSSTDLARGDDNQGVLFTGDIATCDADGFYFIVGRKSRFLKIFGNRVGLDELEQGLSAAGIEVACGGSDDDLIVYTTSPDAQPRIKTFLAGTTSISAKGYRVQLIDQIPRSDSGKILYAELDALSE